MLGWNGALEGDAFGFGHDVAVPVLGEIEALFLLQRRLQVLGAPDEAGLALLADAAAENRLDENFAALGDEVLDLLLASFRAEHSRGRKVHDLQELRSI